MKKYSKGKMKLKRNIIFLAMLFVTLLLVGIVMLFAFCFRNSIEVESQTSDAQNVSDDVAQNSLPIVVDNMVIGATYENRWVSANKYFLKSNNKSDIDIYVYNSNIRAGKYQIKDLYTREDAVFVNTTYPNYIDEYFALSQDTNYAVESQLKEVSQEEKDYQYVKKALGFYRLYNSSIKINNVYSGYLNSSTPIRIISVTSSKKGIVGGIYSAIIATYPNENTSKIVQYSYTKDLDNADDFPIYSLEFLADFNGDGNAELVTREVKEFEVEYNIFECKDNKYTRVLNEKIKLN